MGYVPQKLVTNLPLISFNFSSQRISHTECQHESRSPKRPKLTINNLPDEILIEVFDFYRQGRFDPSRQWRQGYESNESYYYRCWSIELEWFKLIHVCKRWRTVMFMSSSRLNLCFVLTPRNGGRMKTIMSRRFPPLPIAIDYNLPHQYPGERDIGRMLAAFKHPNRIRAITLVTGWTTIFDKLFKAAQCPFPALESLELRNSDKALKIPTSFLGGSNHQELRTLKLHRVSLSFIVQFLSAAPALTHLSLVIDIGVGPQPAMSPIVCLRGMPCLRHLDLEINSFIDGMEQAARPTEKFSLPKLAYFRYSGYSAFLNALTAVLTVPCLREAHISLLDPTCPFPHILRSINDIEEHFYAYRVSHDGKCFRLDLFTHSEYIGRHSPRFTLRSNLPYVSIWQVSSMFPEKLITVQDLSVGLDGIEPEDQEVEVYCIPWRRFLLQFPRLNALHLEGVNCLRIASALHEDVGGLLAFSSLEEIEIYPSSESHAYGDRRLQYTSASEQVAIFQPFVSARQQAGFPVKVFGGKPWSH